MKHKNKLQYIKKKWENHKSDFLLHQLQNFISNNLDISRKESLADDDLSQESDDNNESLNFLKEESKEISSPTIPEQKIMSKSSKTKIIGSVYIKDKDLKSMKIDEFEPKFLSNLNHNIKSLFPDEVGKIWAGHDYKDLNLFNFDFEKPRNYGKYYSMENLDENLKKFQIFLKREIRRNRRVSIMKKEKYLLR